MYISVFIDQHHDMYMFSKWVDPLTYVKVRI
jgi:hypothetical protein